MIAIVKEWNEKIELEKCVAWIWLIVEMYKNESMSGFVPIFLFLIIYLSQFNIRFDGISLLFFSFFRAFEAKSIRYCADIQWNKRRVNACMFCRLVIDDFWQIHLYHTRKSNASNISCFFFFHFWITNKIVESLMQIQMIDIVSFPYWIFVNINELKYKNERWKRRTKKKPNWNDNIYQSNWICSFHLNFMSILFSFHLFLSISLEIFQKKKKKWNHFVRSATI